MLEELRITDLGVIAEAAVDLGPGLTVVTGETGAGKTMMVTALSLLFGGRADVTRVRGGATRAIVEGRVRLTAGEFADVSERLDEAGAEIEDGELIIARSISGEGRSRAHLGGRVVPAGVLGDVGDQLLTIHGQSDQALLLRPSVQRAALDRFAGVALGAIARRHREVFEEWRRLSTEIAERRAAARERAQEADLLRFGMAEIAAVDPQPGEDVTLRIESLRLEHADGLKSAAQTAHHALAGDPLSGSDDGDVSGLLGVAFRALGGVADDDPALRPLVVRAGEIAAAVADLAADLASYVDGIDADPARLAAIHDRRAELAQLTRKYADSVDGVLEWMASAGDRLDSLDSSEEALLALTNRRDEAEAELGRLAVELSAARHAAAVRFGSAVTAELAGLAMPDAEVRAMVVRKPVARASATITLEGGDAVGIGPDGIDDVELQLVSHPGSPALPLQRGASGGELSRVMLAVEVVFAGSGGTPTMVFDEVDAGVGGKAAIEVGRRLAQLARHHQVLVVTHLPQVAAYADHHLSVVKGMDGSVTTSGIQTLDDDQRARELARMLAGMEDSELGLAHAAELLASARDDKSRLAGPTVPASSVRRRKAVGAG